MPISARPLCRAAMTAWMLATLPPVPIHGQSGSQPDVSREPVSGIINFARLETTVACGGTMKTEAIESLKQLGFKSIFDLQLPAERGVDIDGESAAARATGLTFVHVPFTPATPDTRSVDLFLKEISKPANQPAFIHCAAGNRAAGFWLIKRVIVDGWDIDRATTEAEALGLSSAGMKHFALEYVGRRRPQSPG